MALSPAKVPVAWVIWLMLGHMGHVGQMGQMGGVGQMGQMGRVGQMGHVGQIGHWVVWVRISLTKKKKWPIASPLLLGALSNSEFLKQYRRSVRINRVRCVSVFGCGPVLY